MSRREVPQFTCTRCGRSNMAHTLREVTTCALGKQAEAHMEVSR